MDQADIAALIRARQYAGDGRGQRLRKDAGVSLRESAAIADLNLSTLYRWETGARRPRGDAAVRYGRLLADLEEALVGAAR